MKELPGGILDISATASAGLFQMPFSFRAFPMEGQYKTNTSVLAATVVESSSV